MFIFSIPNPYSSIGFLKNDPLIKTQNFDMDPAICRGWNIRYISIVIKYLYISIRYSNFFKSIYKKYVYIFENLNLEKNSMRTVWLAFFKRKCIQTIIEKPIRSSFRMAHVITHGHSLTTHAIQSWQQNYSAFYAIFSLESKTWMCQKET